MSTRLDGDVVVSGNLKAGSFTLPSNIIGDSQVSSANPIGANKLIQQVRQSFSQKRGVAVAAERKTIHMPYAAGELESFRACLSVACIGDSTITVDLLKNGTTILSTDIDFTSAVAAYAFVTATFSSTPYIVTDVFEVNVTVSAGTGTLGQGIFADLVVREQPE